MNSTTFTVFHECLLMSARNAITHPLYAPRAVQ
jgi:hypothetical protein